MNNDLCFLSAVEAVEQFKSGTLSPRELMAAVIAQAEQVEPDINAFSHTWYEEAMEQAAEAETRYQQGSPLGPLDGLPVAIKDEVDVLGQPNTEGSLIHEDRISTEDAVLVARLREAGAIFHARTTCPEFCTLWNTHTRLHGVTRNPWNLDITPGGSSGGSGASLAAGTSTLATGSDIGGSIRFPASQSGLVGFKPPYGRVPETYVPFNMEPYCANGPMARSVADTALMQNIMSGAHPCDAASTLPDVVLPLTYPSDLRGTRIAYSVDFGRLEVEADVVRNTLSAIDLLRSMGAEVVEVELDWPDNIERAYNGHMDPLTWAGMYELAESHGELFCDYNLAALKQARERQREDTSFYDATCVEADMYIEFARVMASFDAFVCPTVNSNKMRADFNPAHDKYMVNGKEVAYDLEISTCHFFNMMRRCPSMSIPSGIGDNGVPTGLHIAATAFQDEQVFRVAAAFETGFMASVGAVFRPPSLSR
jgi:Asp-tRNA(Asn)/Glu-tRNA(Gln) amidotransferase A subunit family amidase